MSAKCSHRYVRAHAVLQLVGVMKGHALRRLVMQQEALDNTEAPGIGSGMVREREKKSALCKVALQRTSCEHCRSLWELVVIQFTICFVPEPGLVALVVMRPVAHKGTESPCPSIEVTAALWLAAVQS